MRFLKNKIEHKKNIIYIFDFIIFFLCFIYETISDFFSFIIFKVLFNIFAIIALICYVILHIIFQIFSIVFMTLIKMIFFMFTTKIDYSTIFVYLDWNPTLKQFFEIIFNTNINLFCMIIFFILFLFNLFFDIKIKNNKSFLEELDEPPIKYLFALAFNFRNFLYVILLYWIIKKLIMLDIKIKLSIPEGNNFTFLKIWGFLFFFYPTIMCNIQYQLTMSILAKRAHYIKEIPWSYIYHHLNLFYESAITHQIFLIIISTLIIYLIKYFINKNN